MERTGKWIGGVVICALLALAVAPWGVVRVLAVEVEGLGISSETVPDEARRLLWSRFGGAGEPRLPEGSYLRLLKLGYAAGQDPDPPLRLAMTATVWDVPRTVGSSRLLWRLRFGASIARLSREWTPTQALAAVLIRAHYGHRFRGFEAAAHGYFGRKPVELTRAELASLVVVANRVVKFNPWCRPHENAEAASRLLAGFEPGSERVADPLARLRPAPEGACAKR